MSVVPARNRFTATKFALLLAGLLAQHGALVRADGAPVLFHATAMPLADSVVQDPVGDAGEVASFAAFMPLPDAASIRAQLAVLEDAGDMYSPGYAELAEQLGKVLQASGEHEAALAAFDRSFQASRRQEGLFSAAQAAVRRAQIESHLALGDIEAADAVQASLFTMQQRLHADAPVELAEAHRAAADWNLKYYLQAQQAVVPGGRTDAERQALAERLGAALGQYHRALWLLSTGKPDGLHAEKVAVERKIAALTLLVDRQYQRDTPALLAKPGLGGTHQESRAHNPVLAAHGSAALQRALAYGAEGAAPAQLAARQLELADWYLLMDQHDAASATYAAALSALRAAALPQAEIDALVASGLPVHDPAAELLALTRDDAAGEYDGYIDVAFDVDRNGRARNARVLAGTAFAAPYDSAMEDELLRQIRGGKFRPAFEQDVPAARDDVTLRYYFAR